MVPYVNYSPGQGTPYRGICPICHEDVTTTVEDNPDTVGDNPEDQLVMHEPGGIKHPLHRRCAKDMHNAGRTRCPTCVTVVCDELTLYGQNELLKRLFIKILQSSLANHLSKIALSAFAFTAYYDASLRAEQNTPPNPLSMIEGIVIGFNGALEVGWSSTDDAMRYLAAITVLNGMFFLDPKTSLVAIAGGVIILTLAKSTKKMKQLASLVILTTLPYFAGLLGGSSAVDFELQMMFAVGLAAGLGTILSVSPQLNLPRRVPSEFLVYPEV